MFKLHVLVLLCLISKITCENDTAVPERLPRYPRPEYRGNTTEIKFFPRIIGGVIAQAGEFPGKVSLQTRRGAHMCGGVIINLNHVLTAAHCVTTEVGAVLPASLLRLMADDLLITVVGSSSRQIRFPTHIFVHLRYSAHTFENDIGVIRVDQPFQLTTTLGVVARILESPIVAQRCELAGWGATVEGGSANPRLLRVDLEIKDTRICNGSSSYNGIVPPGSFCAGAFAGGVDACQGDSGGALICGGRIAGLVSSGYGCGRPNFPGIYVDVSLHHHWIEHSMTFTGPNSDIIRPTTIRPGTGATMSPPSILLTIMTVVMLSCFLNV